MNPGGSTGSRRHTAGTEWVGGKVLSPMWITEPEPYRAEIILWVEIPEELVVQFALLDPQRPVPFARTLRDAMRAPMVGPPRRPRRVRVADEALAAELRADLGGQVPVIVAPTPELNRVVDVMARTMPGSDERQSYLEGGRVPEEAVAQLFRAAAALYALAPWKVASDNQILRIDVRELGIAGACLSIIGALGESLGFVLFPSLEAWEQFADLAGAGPPDDRPIDLGSKLLALTFCRGAELPARMRREAAEHGWKVAGPDVYPVVECRDPDAMPRPLNARDVQLAAACAGALSAFFAGHRETFERDRFAAVSNSYQGDTGLCVRITAPYEAFDAFEGDEAAGLAAPLPRVGRNDPCPCGSGKKYKKCHLGREETHVRAPARPENPHQLGGRLTEEIFAHARRELSRSWSGFVEKEGLVDVSPEFTLPWMMHELPWDGRTAAARFREIMAERLSGRERDWLDAEANAWLSIWEVTAVDAGESVTLKDFLTGVQRRVTEREGSKQLFPRDAVLGRVVEFEGQFLLSGLFPLALPPLEAFDVVKRVRAHLRRRREVPIARLKAPKIGPYLVRCWMDAIAELQERRAEPPRLANTDGDAILLTVDHFDLQPDMRAAVETRLMRLPGVSSFQGADGTTVIDFHCAGERPNSPLGHTVIGTARIRANGLTLETNSVQRAADLRHAVERACSGSVRHRIRDHTDPRAVMRAATPRAPRPAPIEGPEIDALIRQHKERHYADWIDQPIPALGGKTPRAALRTRDGRERLEALVNQIENSESRQPAGQRFDIAILRRQLGLTP